MAMLAQRTMCSRSDGPFGALDNDAAERALENVERTYDQPSL